jgi:hypothetical protein
MAMDRSTIDPAGRKLAALVAALRNGAPSPSKGT